MNLTNFGSVWREFAPPSHFTVFTGDADKQFRASSLVGISHHQQYPYTTSQIQRFRNSRKTAGERSRTGADRQRSFLLPRRMNDFICTYGNHTLRLCRRTTIRRASHVKETPTTLPVQVIHLPAQPPNVIYTRIVHVNSSTVVVPYCAVGFTGRIVCKPMPSSSQFSPSTKAHAAGLCP